MNWPKRLALVFSLGLIVWCYYGRWSERWQAQLRSWQSRRSVEDTVRSTAYPLSRMKWLEFDLPTQAVGLRLLTNAAVSDTRPEPGTAGRRWASR
jgi:hypothetical protein